MNKETTWRYGDGLIATVALLLDGVIYTIGLWTPCLVFIIWSISPNTFIALFVVSCASNFIPGGYGVESYVARNKR